MTLMGLLQLSFLVRFLSRPALSGLSAEHNTVPVLDRFVVASQLGNVMCKPCKHAVCYKYILLVGREWSGREVSGFVLE